MGGGGPVLLVIDNGWAAAADWPRRMQMANTVLDRTARAGRSVALLATAAGETGAAPTATAAMPVADLRPRLGALRPQAWPSDRAAALPGTPAKRITRPRQGKNEAGPTCSDIGPADHGSNPWVPLIVMPRC